MKLQPNTEFAQRYTLLKQLGTGGFSEVWLASDQMAGDLEIALKIFAPGQGLDDQAIQIFREEYKGVFYLHHPHLLKPTHFDIYQGRPYLVIPYCKNGSVIKMTGQADETTLARIMEQIGGALSYLHSLDPPVIHRDIKPENILMDEQGHFFLSDFGISQKLRRTLTKSIGHVQESAGTTAFMAPELFQSKRTLIPESDVFAFGTMLYEMVTDELPFGQIGGSLLMNGAEVPDITDRCDPGLARLIARCLSLSPAGRPSCEEIAQTGKAYLETGNFSENLSAGNKERKTRFMNRAGNETQQQPRSRDGLNPEIHLLLEEADAFFNKKLYKPALKKYREILEKEPLHPIAREKANQLEEIFENTRKKQSRNDTLLIVGGILFSFLVTLIIIILANS